MAVKEKNYIETNEFHKELNAVKDAINKLGQNLADKLDDHKDSVNEAMLKIHKDYSDRLARLEEQSKNAWQTRVLYTLCGGMAAYILNHILTK